MRLGAYPCHLSKDSHVREIYGSELVYERHRHRYEFNNKYCDLFEKNGMNLPGLCKERGLVEILEITEHPWFVGVQFHPEFKSRPMSPHPLFLSFVEAAGDHKRTLTRASRRPSSGRSKKALRAKNKSLDAMA